MFICGTQYLDHHCPQKTERTFTVSTSLPLTHRHRRGDGSRKAPDQSVVHGQPTVVRVSVAFRVQSHRQTWKPSEADARRHQITAPQIRACFISLCNIQLKPFPNFGKSLFRSCLENQQQHYKEAYKFCPDVFLEGISHCSHCHNAHACCGITPLGKPVGAFNDGTVISLLKTTLTLLFGYHGIK